MTQDLYQYCGYIVLLGFFIAFVGIAVWTYRPANKDALEALGRIPLQEGQDD
jgi:cbb3-type cytochrome oxidase subunit 3